MQFVIADDDSDDIELLAEALKTIQPAAEFITASTGKQLLSLLPNYRPNVIFLDINMPEMNGWDCLRVLKNEPVFREIPVIVYTTSSSRRDIDLARDLGAYSLVTKPDRFRDLLKIMTELIPGIKGLADTGGQL